MAHLHPMQGNFGDISRHSGWLQLGVGRSKSCSWQLVGRGQGCCQTAYNAQGNRHCPQQRALQLRMPKMPTLTHPRREQTICLGVRTRSRETSTEKKHTELEDNVKQKHVLFAFWNKIAILRNTDNGNSNRAVDGIECELGRPWPQMDRSLSEHASRWCPQGIQRLRTSRRVCSCLRQSPGSVLSLRCMSSSFRGSKFTRCSIKVISAFWHSSLPSIDEASRKPNENNTRKSLHQHPSLMSQLSGHCFCFSPWKLCPQPT